jgi:predicted nucleic acid-binding protein
MAADLIFIDTNLLVAASVEGHPSHVVATALLTRLGTRAAEITRLQLHTTSRNLALAS